MDFTCAKPRVSSYGLMNCLFARLVKRNTTVIDLPKIVNSLYNFKKKNDKYSFLFEDVEFRKSSDYVVSSDISESINRLQTFGAIGKLNPSYEKVVIYLTEDEADKVLSDCDEDIKVAVNDLSESFCVGV